MTKGNDSRNRVTKRIRRIARIWSFPIIVYALLMLIGYAWNWVTIGVADPHVVEDYPPIEALPPILMFLSVSWDWALPGVGSDWEERLPLFSSWPRFRCFYFIVRSLTISPVQRFLISCR